MPYVQTVRGQIPVARLEAALGPDGILPALEAHRDALARQPGFEGMRIERAPAPGGGLLLSVETRWRDSASLAAYERAGESVQSIVRAHREEFEPDTIDVEEGLPAVHEPSRDVFERLAMPLLVPVAAFVGGLAIIFLLSRIYLELSNEAATGVSLAVALGILLTAALAASGERLPALPVGGIAAAAVALLIGFGAWAAISPDEVAHEAAAGGEQPTPAAGEPTAPGGIVIVAKNILFDQKELRVPAGEPFTVVMRNEDAGVPHNWALYTDDSATQPIAGANEGICTGPCEDDVE
ncbi:MAG TPA: hypothetical protein VNM43_06495, partial [Dehalococcoidia bacterium]|nr:hypothetical protein [Dehalococcoidia bacterium]